MKPVISVGSWAIDPRIIVADDAEAATSALERLFSSPEVR